MIACYYVLWFIVICDMHDSELQSWDFRVPRVRARGPIESWGWRAPLRHIDLRVNRVTASSGYYVLEWYFGELTKHLCLQCYVLCVSGTSDDRGKAPAWFVHTHTGVYVFWSWVLYWYNVDTMFLFMITNDILWISKVKNCSNFYGVTSWYQSLGLRDSDACSSVSELKLRIWEIPK